MGQWFEPLCLSAILLAALSTWTEDAVWPLRCEQWQCSEQVEAERRRDADRPGALERWKDTANTERGWDRAGGV